MLDNPSRISESVKLSPLAEAAIAAIETCKQNLDPIQYRTLLIFLVNAADRIRVGKVDVEKIFPCARLEDFQNREYVFRKVWAYEARLMAGG